MDSRIGENKLKKSKSNTKLNEKVLVETKENVRFYTNKGELKLNLKLTVFW